MRVESALSGQLTIRMTGAICLYEQDGTKFATLHDVAIEDGAPIILPGHGIAPEAIEKMLRDVSKAPQRRQIMPPNVLCMDSVKMAWWTPSSRRPIFFNTAKKEFNKAVNGKVVPYPPLLFIASGRQLSVYALAEDKRPEADEPLFIAPFFNLYNQGLMCSGNARMPEIVAPSSIPQWEKAFFETNFTHTNTNKLTTHKDGHDGLWLRVAANPEEGFPIGALLPAKKTLEEAVNQ